MFWGKDFYKNFQKWADAIQGWHPEGLEKALNKAWEFLQEYSPKITAELVKLLDKMTEATLRKMTDTVIDWLKKVGLLKK